MVIPVIILGVFCGQVLTVVTDLMYGNSRDNSRRVLWTGLDGGGTGTVTNGVIYEAQNNDLGDLLSRNATTTTATVCHVVVVVVVVVVGAAAAAAAVVVFVVLNIF